MVENHEKDALATGPNGALRHGHEDGVDELAKIRELRRMDQPGEIVCQEPCLDPESVEPDSQDRRQRPVRDPEQPRGSVRRGPGRAHFGSNPTADTTRPSSL